MNRDELEKWMRDSLDNQEFTPNETGWNKLQSVLDKSVKKDNRKGFVFLFPKSIGIAASVMLFIVTASLIFLMSSRNKNKNTDIITQHHSLSPLFPEKTDADIVSADQQSGTDDEISISQSLNTNDKNKTNTHIHNGVDSLSYANASQAEPAKKPDAPATNSNVYIQPEKKAPASFDFSEPLPDNEYKRISSFNFGIAAQFGKANIGNMRYQLGVVARQKISEKFYAEATVSLASTEVSYIQKNSFQTLTVSTSAANNIGTKSIDAQYGSNIISAGISPSVGYKITPKLAIGGGFTFYRNLDQSLSLKNSSDIETAVLNNHLISETNFISKWDAGLTGSASCNIGSRLTINMQYRHGISTFMYFNNQPIRNSGFNMGLSYLFGK